jgi:hypothetical protein
MGAEFTIEPKTIRPGGVRFILKAHWLDDARATIMAKLPLRFLPAAAIPLAVAIGAGGAPAQSPEVAGLLAASKEEMAYKGPLKPSAPRTRRGRLTKEKGVT